MKILAIETSCDETAIAILDAQGSKTKPHFDLLSNVVLSQIKIHQPFGGVVPNLAQREHQKNLVPILIEALKKADLLKNRTKQLEVISPLTPLLKKEGGKKREKFSLFLGEVSSVLNSILNREPVLLTELEKFLKKHETPDIDVVAVTYGPGLEPALWVGLNFAKALSKIWGKPLIPVNHLEGHIYANWILEKNESPKFPALALIVSGGHTELVLVKNHLQYKKLGETRDDAAGEAFDKVAKMLKLGYPGGPEISRIAEEGDPNAIAFPRPMLNSNDFDFSFSGLKTAVLYYLRDGKLAKSRFDTESASEPARTREGLRREGDKRLEQANIAASFEQAVVDVLVSKTAKALKKYKVKSLIVGGGVAANKKLRTSLTILVEKLFPDTHLFLSPVWLTGDNAAMISVAAYFRSQKTKKLSHRQIEKIRAQGNLDL